MLACLTFDRLPLVLSAIINVDQEVEEDWVLEVIGHDGIARNVTIQPGEMILYESHSLIHGRPYPLVGSMYANAFLHMEPVGYTAELERVIGAARRSDKDAFEYAMTKQHQVEESKGNDDEEDEEDERPNSLFPSYIQANTLEAIKWMQQFVFHRDEKVKQPRKPKSHTRGVTNAHIAAAKGMLNELERILEEDPGALTRADSNGWKPIHEAARSGKHKVIEFLVKQGADVNERTNKGKGATPLWWAEQQLPPGHQAIIVLRRHGGVAIAPAA